MPSHNLDLAFCRFRLNLEIKFVLIKSLTVAECGGALAGRSVSHLASGSEHRPVNSGEHQTTCQKEL